MALTINAIAAFLYPNKTPVITGKKNNQTGPAPNGPSVAIKTIANA